MADLSQTMNIIFGAVDNASSVIDRMASDIDGAVNRISGVTAPLSNIGNQILTVDAAIVALAGTIAHISINEFEDFRAKVVDMGVIIDATPGQISTMQESILDFANSADSAGASMNGITGAITTALSAGAEYSNVIDLVKVANYGALASSADLAETTQALTGILNAYGLASENSAENTKNAERVIDALFVTTQGGAVTMSELAQQMGRIVATAAAAKVPIETIGAALASMTAEGMTAEGAFTNLQSLLTALLKPTDDLKTALGGMSITTNTLPEIMDKLKTVTGGSADKMAALFGSVEATKAALVLANDASGKFSGTLDMMANKTGKAAEAAKSLANEAKAVAIDMQKAIDVFQTKLGAELDPGWVNIEKAITNVFKALSNGVESGQLKALTDGFNDAYNEVAQVIDAIAKNLPEALSRIDFSKLIGSIKGLEGEAGQILKNLFNGVDITTPEGLADAIQKVVDGATLLMNVGKNILESWQPAVKQLGAFADKLIESDEGAQSVAGHILGYAQQFETFKGAITGGAAALELLAGSMTVIAGINLTTVAGGFAALATAAGSVAAVGAAVATVVYGFDEFAKKVDSYSAAQNTIDESSKSLAENQAKIKDRLLDISEATGILIADMDGLNQAVDDGVLYFNEATGQYENAANKMRDFDAEVRAVAEANGALDGSLGGVSQQLDGLPALWAEIGKAVTSSTKATEDYEKSILKITEATDKYGNSSEKYSGSTREAAAQFASLAGVSGDLAARVAEIVEKGHEFEVVMDGNNTVVRDLTEANKASAQALKDKGQAVAKTKEEISHLNEMEKLAATQAFELQKTLLELDAKRSSDFLNFRAQIDVATIEGETRRVEAAFNSINSVVSDLSDNVSTLWGDYMNASSWDKLELSDAAQRAEQRLDDQLKKQNELIDSQIDLNEARRDALNKGDSIITIKADNLSASLQKVCYEIVENIQIEANLAGMAYLMAEGT